MTKRLVKLRTWNDMKAEYGIDPDGDIPIEDEHFYTTLEKLMPADRIIELDAESYWNIRSDNYIIIEEMIAYDVTIDTTIYKTLKI